MSLKDRSPSCRRDLSRRLATPIMPAGTRRRDRDRRPSDPVRATVRVAALASARAAASGAAA
jgi:hypothetical protein